MGHDPHGSLLDDGWAFPVRGRVEDDLGEVAIAVDDLATVSRRARENAPASAAVAVPRRPPMMMRGRCHDHSGDPTAAAAR